MRLGCFIQHAAQIAVFEHFPEKTIVGTRNEIDGTGLLSVADPDLLDRATLARQPFAKPDCLEQLQARTRNRRGSPVEAGSEHGSGVGAGR